MSDSGSNQGFEATADSGADRAERHVEHFEPVGARWAPLFIAAGRVARAVDDARTRAEDHLLRHTAARRWRTRGRVPSELLPIGRLTGREPMPAILAGLRLGTATLEGDVDAAVDGTVARLAVEHDDLSGDRLSCTLRGSYHQAWLPGPNQELQHQDLVAHLGELPIVVEGATWTGWGTDDSLEPFSRGPCRGIVIGASSLTAKQTQRSRTWHAWLIGAVVPAGPARVKLRGVDITLTEQEEDPRYIGGLSGKLGRWSRSRPSAETIEGWVRAFAEELTWRAAPLPADLPRLVRADLVWDEPVALEEANNFLLENVIWLLSLHVGRWVVLGGIWHPTHPFGYMCELEHPLVSPLRRTVGTSVPLVDYLGSAASAWSAADDQRRLTLRIAIQIRISVVHKELELSIAISAFALEMLVEQLFGDTDSDDPDEAADTASSYGLTKTQKRQIREKLHQAIIDNVPADSDYRRDIEGIESRLFWRTAKDKIGRMLGRYEIPFDADDLDRFIRVRNSITHGNPTEFDVETKVKAMLFGQAMLTRSLLAELTWTGPVYDERQAQLTKRERDGQTKPQAEP